jgi:hypothetical protein
MGRSVIATATFPGSVHEAESCWYDNVRWPSWVDGLERVVERSESWPRVGSAVTWESGPAGRGHVVERVVAYEPLDGQTVEVEDDSIRGRQSVSFTPTEEGVEVALRLEYEIKNRTLFTAMIDWLFIRPAMQRSLRATLTRFGAELAATRQTPLS